MAFIFSHIYVDATDEQKWEQIRSWRDRELAATDWTQLDDAPCDKTAWAAYRQQLRDLPEQIKNPDKIQIPTRPL